MPQPPADRGCHDSPYRKSECFPACVAHLPEQNRWNTSAKGAKPTVRPRRLRIIARAGFVATLLITQLSPPGTAKPLFAGTWEGKINDLPAVNLRIEEANGKISGVMIFYFQERSDANSPWHVAAEYPVPLLAPQVTGDTLTFAVRHHKCHTCPELGPNVKFRMKLAGPNEALLWKLSNEESKDLGPGMKLLRQTENARRI